MTTQIILVALIALGFILLQRRRPHRITPAAPAPDGMMVLDEPIVLQLESLGDDGSEFQWFRLTYADGATTSQVRLGYEPLPPAPGQQFVFTQGLLQPVAGSEAAPLMGALAALHESIDIPVAEPVAEGHRIDVAILGTRLSVGAGGGTVIAGGFTNATPGEWTVLKLFVHGDDEDGDTGELFLALNEAQHTAQFLLKDTEYWPVLAPTFARLLAGTPP